MIEPKRFTNPFPGLRPFETDEYRLFFGREGQSDTLIARLQRARLLAVVGTSGSGKSSLVRAGLLPALSGGMMADAGSGWRISIMRPGNDPFGNLARVLAASQVIPGTVAGLPANETQAVIEATLRGGSLGLVDARRGARLRESEKLLIVVDQFEELFRFRAAREGANKSDDAFAFVKLLLEATSQHELPVYIVLTMRSDFIGDCAQFQGLPEAINDGQYLIPRLTRDERRMAITGPIGVARGRVTEPLVTRLLNDVGDNPDQLPILQHALMRTWDYWAGHRRNGEPLDLKHYESIGTMGDALSKHAEEAWSDLPDECSRQIAENLFKALTEKGADNREIRRPTRLSEIAAVAEVTESEVVRVIDVFRKEGRSFLMPPIETELSSNAVIDISHESLIRNWERLQKWVNEEAQSARIYRRLAEAAVLHREGKEGLLINPALQIALDWREESRPNAEWAHKYDPEFEEALTFLDASKAAYEAQLAEEERKRQEQIARERRELEMAREFAEKQSHTARRLRWLAVGMAIMSMLALVTAAYALAAKRSVESERRKVAALLDQTKAALAQKDVAEKAKEAALQKAVTEEQRAKDEANRANDQAAIAAANLKIAEAARNDAIEKKKQVDAALNRGEFLRKGLEAYGRADYEGAFGFFDKLRSDLNRLQPHALTGAADLRTSEGRQYANDLGWTLSKFGAAHQRNPRKSDYDQAIDSYEQALRVFGQTLPKDSDEQILVETYDGLGQSYYERAESGSAKRDRHNSHGTRGADNSSSEEDLTKAEKFFQLALEFKTKYKPLEAADSHLDLARLDVVKGRLPAAQDHFETAVRLRRLQKKNEDLTPDERVALVSALREVGEFYWGPKGDYDRALALFNEMIVIQEAITVDELVDQGNEIANSYSDLAQIRLMMANALTLPYKGQTQNDDLVLVGQRPKTAEENSQEAEAKKQTDEATLDSKVASFLQKTALTLRQVARTDDLSKRPALIGELAIDLDELGDSYAKMKKLSDAEALYLTASSYRAGTNEQWKSYDKLATFYRSMMKDAAKAGEYENLLQPAIKDNADVLIELGTIHSDDRYSDSTPKPTLAEKYYFAALASSKGDWVKENLILFRLSKLYSSQDRKLERLQIQRQRIAVMANYYQQLAANAEPVPKDPSNLVNQYLYALNAIAYGNKDNTEAEACYRQALDAYDYVVRNISNATVLIFYAKTLEDYQALLANKLFKQAEADAVAAKAKAVRDKLRQLTPSTNQPNIETPSDGEEVGITRHIFLMINCGTMNQVQC